MKQALLLLAVFAMVFAASDAVFGYHVTFAVGYGALALMALMISLTFLWLWLERATPLALGMSFSWAGAACVTGYWWLFRAVGQPETLRENGLLFLFLSLYFVGAILHFGVMQRSMGLKTGVFAVPVVVAFVIASLANVLT